MLPLNFSIIPAGAITITTISSQQPNNFIKFKLCTICLLSIPTNRGELPWLPDSLMGSKRNQAVSLPTFTAQAMLTYNVDRKGVELRVDREYAKGEPVNAWCGPQPNTRLLLNYGLVDENNQWDKLPITIILASTDPLFQLKR